MLLLFLLKSSTLQILALLADIQEQTCIFHAALQMGKFQGVYERLQTHDLFPGFRPAQSTLG